MVSPTWREERSAQRRCWCRSARHDCIKLALEADAMFHAIARLKDELQPR
ncbi:MAG TPA: hypothetical protein VNL98_03865 [Gemmatimonadales bacterium]|nr:hypothetical protein [Gemmatimonadales bacterium]